MDNLQDTTPKSQIYFSNFVEQKLDWLVYVFWFFALFFFPIAFLTSYGYDYTQLIIWGILLALPTVIYIKIAKKYFWFSVIIFLLMAGGAFYVEGKLFFNNTSLGWDGIAVFFYSLAIPAGSFILAFLFRNAKKSALIIPLLILLIFSGPKAVTNIFNSISGVRLEQRYENINNLAIATGNAKICLGLPSFNNQLECVMKTQTDKTVDSTCGVFSNPERYSCFLAIAKAREDRSVCLLIPKEQSMLGAQSMRDDCFSTTDIWRDKIDLISKEEFNQIFKQCDDYSNSGICLWFLAKKTNNLNICMDPRMRNDDNRYLYLRDSCIEAVATNTNNEKDCLKIEKQDLQQRCIYDISEKRY